MISARSIGIAAKSPHPKAGAFRNWLCRRKACAATRTEHQDLAVRDPRASRLHRFREAS